MTPSSPALLPDARVATLLARRKAEPGNVEVLRQLATAYNARNMGEQARAVCDDLLSRAPKDGTGWYEAVIARSFGQRSELEKLAPRVMALVKENPKAGWAHRNAGLLAYYLDDDDGTRRSCEKALALDRKDSRAHEVLAYLAYTVGSLDGAIESGIKAVELDAKNFRALHWLGECYIKLDAPEQAVRYFQRALELEDCHFFALESLGAVYLRDRARFPLACQCFARILSVDPRYFPVYFRLADAFIQEERLTEAAAQAEAVLHLDPEPAIEADAHQYLGLIALVRRDMGPARTHLQRALSIDPRFAAAHHYIGVVAEHEGDVASAEASYKKAVSLDREYALPRVRLGYLCFDRKDYEASRRHFEAALGIDEEDYLAHLGLGEIARWRGDHVGQLAHCRRAAELAPDDGNVRNQLGTAHDALGDAAAAIREYDAALRLDPYNRQAANNLGYLFERLMRDAPAADRDRLRQKAVAAWKRRLLICRDTRSSTRGARTHLEKLGVSARQIGTWLEKDKVA